VKFGAPGFLIVLVALSGALGCSAAEVTRPAAADDRETLTDLLAVNSRCPGFKHATSSPQVPRDDLFLEAVILEVTGATAQQASLANLQDLPRTAQVRLVAAPHLLGRFDTTTEMGLGPDGGAEHLTLVRASMLPRHADRSAVLELELELDSPTSRNDTLPSRRTVAFTTTARDNEPTLAKVAWDETSQRSLLVLLRTFEIRSEDDLRAIFQCKMEQRARTLKRLGAQSP